jgi:hypothetical protein
MEGIASVTVCARSYFAIGLGDDPPRGRSAYDAIEE